MKYTTSVPAIYTIDKECVYESHMFGAAPLASKGRHVRAEANAGPSQSTDSNEKGEQGSRNIGIRRLGGWSCLLHIVELSAKLAASGLSPMLPQGGWVVSSDDFEAGDDEVRRRLRSLEFG